MTNNEENGAFTAKRIACSVVVIVLAGIALTVIWNPDVFASVDWLIAILFDLSLTLVVLLVALASIAWCWCPAPRVRVDSSDHETRDATDNEELPCPYPATYNKQLISGFQYSSDLHLVRLKKRLPEIGPEEQYIVAKDYEVCFRLNDSKRSVKVPRGMLSDLATVPIVFRWVVGRVGPHLEATIVHDYLYMAWQLESKSASEKKMSEMRRFSDDLMFAAMKEAGMGCKAHLIYIAVRLFGRCIFHRKKKKPLILPSEHWSNCSDG